MPYVFPLFAFTCYGLFFFMVEKYLISDTSVQKNRAYVKLIACPLKPEWPSEKSVQILFTIKKIKGTHWELNYYAFSSF